MAGGRRGKKAPVQQPDAAPAEAPSRKRAADAQEESADTSDSAPSPKRHRANPAAASQEADTSDSPGGEESQLSSGDTDTDSEQPDMEATQPDLEDMRDASPDAPAGGLGPSDAAPAGSFAAWQSRWPSTKTSWVSVLSYMNLRRKYQGQKNKKDTWGQWRTWSQCKHLMRIVFAAALGKPVGTSRGPKSAASQAKWPTARDMADTLHKQGITHIPLALIVAFGHADAAVSAQARADDGAWAHQYWWPPPALYNRKLERGGDDGLDAPHVPRAPRLSKRKMRVNTGVFPCGHGTSVRIMEVGEACAYIQRGRCSRTAKAATAAAARNAAADRHAVKSVLAADTAACCAEARVLLRQTGHVDALSTLHRRRAAPVAKQRLDAPVFIGLGPLASEYLPKLGCGKCEHCVRPTHPHLPCLRAALFMRDGQARQSRRKRAAQAAEAPPRIRRTPGRSTGDDTQTTAVSTPVTTSSETESDDEASDSDRSDRQAGSEDPQDRQAGVNNSVGGVGTGASSVRQLRPRAPPRVRPQQTIQRRAPLMVRRQQLRDSLATDVAAQLRESGQERLVPAVTEAGMASAWRAGAAAGAAAMPRQAVWGRVVQRDSVLTRDASQLQRWRDVQAHAGDCGVSRVTFQYMEGEVAHAPTHPTAAAKRHLWTLPVGNAQSGKRDVLYAVNPTPYVGPDGAFVRVKPPGKREPQELGPGSTLGLRHTDLMALEQHALLQEQLRKAPPWLRHVGPETVEGLARMREAMALMGLGAGADSGASVDQSEVWQSPEVCLAILLIAEEHAASVAAAVS